LLNIIRRFRLLKNYQIDVKLQQMKKELSELKKVGSVGLINGRQGILVFTKQKNMKMLLRNMVEIILREPLLTKL
jgi:hypothetical protein